MGSFEKLILFLGGHLAFFLITALLIWIFNRKLYSTWITRIKWFLWEVLKMYSGQPSFFAKKRIESGIAFIILQWGMIFFLVHTTHQGKMDISALAVWASIEGVICGYMINQIQKEKKPISGSDESTSDQK